MTITARYASRCARCRQPITAGSKIEWNRTTPVSHVAGGCPTTDVSLGQRDPSRTYIPRRAFTCPRCGDHRDTTISGRCDDCEA